MKISIITPVKNRVDYIEKCINSVASQTHDNYEHILVDGESSDGTCDIILNAINNGNTKIKYLSELDSSPGEAWNKGIQMVTGDVIGWLGADDSFVDANVLDFVATFYKNNNDICVVYGGCNFINTGNQLCGTSEDYNHNINKLLNRINYIPATSLFAKRVVFEKVGELDLYGNDFDYVLRIAKKFTIVPVNKILSNFMLATDSETGDFRKYTKVLKLDWHVSKKHGGHYFNTYHIRYILFAIASLIGLSDILNILRNKRKGNNL